MPAGWVRVGSVKIDSISDLGESGIPELLGIFF